MKNTNNNTNNSQTDVNEIHDHFTADHGHISVRKIGEYLTDQSLCEPEDREYRLETIKEAMDQALCVETGLNSVEEAANAYFVDGSRIFPSRPVGFTE